jgi:para-aminobenzoate synthetase component 1
VHAGDCFQVNIAQRLLARLTEHPFDLYSRLRERNPAPFAGYFDLGPFAIASASPERFVRVNNNEVETRPIKGTRPRSASPQEDQQLIAELAASAKDRAENVMIVDLLRNDLGRVVNMALRSIHCQVESYQYVHHLVSEGAADSRGKTPVDLLRACFPVVGDWAPKVRAMEIIADRTNGSRTVLRQPRLSVSMAMDSNTDSHFTAGGWLQFPVGVESLRIPILSGIRGNAARRKDCCGKRKCGELCDSTPASG